ncbi:MAG: GNAT family N-acetyltransferase [Solirubrobacteraceae bacterium]
MSEQRVEVAPFARGHLAGAMAIFAEERWAYAQDAERTWRALTAPGTETLVAVRGEDVLGLAQTMSDGEIQTFLSALIVARASRDAGIGRALVAAALERNGGIRLDLISEADGFYEVLGFVRMSGFRLKMPARR